MSTRANIAIRREDGKYLEIYNHSDGYPTWLGRCLLHNYTTYEKVMALINLGNISFIGTNPYVDYNKENEDKDEEGFNIQVRDFHRWRGDECAPVELDSPVLNEEYLYVFENNKWYIADYDYSTHRIPPLRELTEEDVKRNG